MTLAEIVAAVKTNHQRDDKDAVAKVGVTLALQRVVAQWPLSGLIRTEDLDVAAGAYSVMLPVKVARVIKAYWINGTQSWALTIRTREWVGTRVPEPTAFTTSYPDWGWLEGNKINFTPGIANNGTFRVTYQYIPEMVNDTDTTPMELIDEVLISHATAHVFQSLGLLAEANYWRGQGDQALARAINVDSDQPAIIHRADQRGEQVTPFVEPHLDPFAIRDPRVG